MPQYSVVCSRIKEVFQTATVELWAADEDAAQDMAEVWAKAGDLTFTDHEDGPEYTRHDYDVLLIGKGTNEPEEHAGIDADPGL